MAISIRPMKEANMRKLNSILIPKDMYSENEPGEELTKPIELVFLLNITVLCCRKLSPKMIKGKESVKSKPSTQTIESEYAAP